MTPGQIVLSIARMNEVQFEQFYHILKLLKEFKESNNPQNFLAKLQLLSLDFIDNVVIEKTPPPAPQTTFMSKLQTIKIDGPKDFAENIDLYLNGEKTKSF